MIRHTVVFRLHTTPESPATQQFLDRAKILRKIPGVQQFEQLRQVSTKNDFNFGFSMEFVDQAAYDGYNNDPQHVAFVADHWIPEVAEFMEIDYIVMS